ncbi:LysE family translocator [Cytobacillus firmus]|uniref:LysE family translocator n=1 Tax=Cytobacillus firmus TaxID=1399 RepID=UPI001CFEAC5B|nr:LysE family translocator [Cytobacillus firmus]WHY62454.1 LysE family translocator [Cytobacillus firmus]
MFGIQDFSLFLITTIIFIIVPGIDAMFVLSKNISNGRAIGIASSAGVATGAFVHTVLSVIGLSFILSQSVVIFTALKVIGGIYLIYIGAKSLFQKSKELEIKRTSSGSLKKDYMQGVLTNVSNPKSILFYLSFLPQFISADNSYGSLPFLILWATFSMFLLVWYVLVSYGAALATKNLKDSKVINAIMNKVAGVVFIGIGLKLMAAKPQ